jgi:hypothetical protein
MKRCNLLIFFIITALTVIGCKEEYVRVGSNWDALYNLKAPEKSFKVKVKGKEKVKIGDALTFTVTSEKNGKLWVVQVDSDDETTLLIPNDKMTDNRVFAGSEITIPPKGVNWGIEAGEPRGKSVVAFIVTTGDADIGDVLSQRKDVSKAIRLVSDAGEWGIHKLVIETK